MVSWTAVAGGSVTELRWSSGRQMAATPMQDKRILLLGPNGAGKSTAVSQLKKRETLPQDLTIRNCTGTHQILSATDE